jgi:hypothetical protein
MLKADIPNQVRLPDQQQDVAPNSPIAVVALFTEIVRERFRPGNDLSWVWSPNPTPIETESNEPGDPRKILIAPSFAVHGEARNVRPAIIVSKGATVSQKTVLNNQYGQQINTGKKGFWLPATIPLTFEVLSDQEGESAVIADLVWYYLLAAREPVRAEFGIHNYSDPVLGATRPYTEAKDHFSTQVTMDVTLEFKWLTEPATKPIKEVRLQLKEKYGGNLDQLVLTQYLR